MWNARNHMVFRNITSDPVSIAPSSLEFVSEFNLANPNGPKPRNTSMPNTVPDESLFSQVISVDAGCLIHEQLNVLTFAAVKRR